MNIIISLPTHQIFITFGQKNTLSFGVHGLKYGITNNRDKYEQVDGSLFENQALIN